MASQPKRHGTPALADLLPASVPGRCAVPPSPELLEKLRTDLEHLGATKRGKGLGRKLKAPEPRRPGLNDGLIVPGSYFPLGTSVEGVRWHAAERAPLRGTVQVIAVLVDFSDQPFANGAATRQHFEDLFFSSTGVAGGTQSVRQYYSEVSNGLVDIAGHVVGPYRMPRTLATYAHGESGMGTAEPNARTMARDAVEAADPDVDFAPYDNDGNGYVDAFIIIHAGRGAEETGSSGDIWSHKWVLAGGEYATDSTKVYGYLTVPEDARLGVCAHELGHLLFGFPDLYDTDGTSEGVGNWCLMGGGSWNGGGNVPAHPSAWCKVQQDWVSVVRQAANSTVSVPDVKDAHRVYRLWKDGAPGQEYFLLENRQKQGFDADLPGEGLLIWHIDEAIAGNTNELHPKVKLEQADGNEDLENARNRGDSGDPFPGSAGKRAFTRSTTPNSHSYGGVDTCVAVTSIPDPGPIMSMHLAVRCGPVKRIEKGHLKERVKDLLKDRKELKEKEIRKDLPDKPVKEIREKGTTFEKPVREKRPEKPVIDKGAALDKPPTTEKGGEKLAEGKPGLGASTHLTANAEAQVLASLEARVAALEALLGESLAPFIGTELRPDLTQSALYDEEDWTADDNDVLDDKRTYDSKPRDQ